MNTFERWSLILLLVGVVVGMVAVFSKIERRTETPITSIFCQQKEGTFSVNKPEGSKSLSYYIKDNTLYVENGLGESAFWVFKAPAMCFINVPVRDAPARPQGRDI